MRAMLNADQPIMAAVSRIADLILLNLVVLLACVPVVTIGASMTGLYHSLIKMRRGEDAHIIRTFWSSFKSNFKQATIIWLVQAIVTVVLIMDWVIVGNTELQFPAFVTVISVIAFIFVSMTSYYVYPLLSHFRNSVAQTVKNGFFFSVMHLLKTVCMLAISVAPVLLFAVWAYSAIFVVLLGISLPAYINAGILSAIFQRYEKQE